MTNKKFASKKRYDGSVYHFPISENQKRPEKEITIHKSQDSSKNTEAKRIAHKILDDYLNQVRNTKGSLDYFKEFMEGIGISLSNNVMEVLRKRVYFRQRDYEEMTKLVQVHLLNRESESEIANASDVKRLKEKILNYEAMRMLNMYIGFNPE